MVPPIIKSNLAGLRMRERLLAFAWGAACWLAVVLVLLLVACGVDWLIDRERETPFAVRVALLLIQAFVAAVAALLFVLWPQIRRLSDTTLALWVEEKIRKFDHRLISAVQFNQPGADLGGMSAELVGVVTHEAEQQAQRVGFAQVADHSRLKWSVLLLVPVFLVALAPLVVWPKTCFALLGRQALLDIDIPHSVELASVSPEHWPIDPDMPIPIRYRVTEYDPEMIGTVFVAPAGERAARYELKFISEDERGAVFGADVKPVGVDVIYSARLLDGRTKYPSEIQLIPRPVVRGDFAWTILPAFCDTRKVAQKIRYEIPQKRGEVKGIPGSSVRVQFEVDSLQHEATLVLLGRDRAAAKPSEDESLLPVKEIRTIPMTIKKGVKLVNDGEQEVALAEAVFNLDDGLAAYRMIVKNEFGYQNKPAKQRPLRLEQEIPPTVNLLRDTFGLGSSASFDLEGMPVRLGKQIRIPYECTGLYGLSKAEVHYRVLKKHESGNDPPEEGRWIKLPLTEVQPDRTAGPFDLKTGVFQNTPFGESVGFHAIPSFNPEFIMGRIQGGGLVQLNTKGLLGDDGLPAKLKSGDQVEYCIVVYGAKRQPEGSTPFTRSESRVATVLDQNAWQNWMASVAREDERVRDLELKQKGVFGPR